MCRELHYLGAGEAVRLGLCASRPLPGVKNAVSLDGTSDAVCAVLETGRVMWGRNANAMFGYPLEAQTPVRVVGLPPPPP